MPEKGSHLLTYYPQGDIYPHRNERMDLEETAEGVLIDRTTKRVLSKKELKDMDFLLKEGNAVLYEKDADGYNIRASRERVTSIFPKPKKYHGKD